MLEYRTLQRMIGWLLPLVGIALMFLYCRHLAPWQRLAVGSLGLLYLIKGTILLQYPFSKLKAFSKLGLLIYLTIWPGMDPVPFIERQKSIQGNGSAFIRGYLFLLAGTVILFFTSILKAVIPVVLTGWLGIVGLLFMIHFGYAEILTVMMKLWGWNVSPLFNEPFKSSSLKDFWSRRWNLAFVEMDKILFWDFLKKHTGSVGALAGVFLISGVLHEIGISYVALEGWGLPILYFVLQGAALILEKRIFGNTEEHTFLNKVWIWGCIIIPLPLLFHAPFQNVIILPFLNYLNGCLSGVTLEKWFDLALWGAGVGNLCTLLAGLQLPWRLKWKEDFGKLTPFNRKIFYNYYFNIGMLIIMLGIFTLTFHHALLRGEPIALFLAGFMGIFWLIRILVDFFYFEHKDWPKGDVFVIGHVLLTTLFVILSSIYLGLVIWHLFLM